MFGFVACEALQGPHDGGQQLRTVYDIVQSCLFTIFACVWKSVHPNIDGPMDSGWTRLKRKVVMALCVVIAPEAVLYWAMFQRGAAKHIAEKYNENFTKSVGLGETVQTETLLSRRVVGWFPSLWRHVTGWFLPLPEESTWRTDGQLWTTTHGFFVQMGGFMLYNNGRPVKVLEYDDLAELLKDKAIDPPTVTEHDLQDRSKGDTTSKAIVILQTMWFVLQCIARVGQRLPLSELEVLTLAFGVMNMAIYAAWWNKPQGVEMAICVPLKNTEMRSAEKGVNVSSIPSEEVSHPKTANSTQPEYHHSNDTLHLIARQSNQSTGQKHSWLRRMLRKDREETKFTVLPIKVLFRLVGSVFRPLAKLLGNTNKSGQEVLRVPMFNGAGEADNEAKVAWIIMGPIFGAVHLLAWASKFSLTRDLVLWRVSAIIMTMAPVVLLLVGFTAEMGSIGDFFAVLFIFLIPLYAAARFVVIIISLLAIHNPPREVLLDVSWTSLMPHF